MWVKSFGLCLCLLQLVSGSSVSMPVQRAEQTDTRISWIVQLQQLRHHLRDCFRSKHAIWPCFREQSLQLFDGIMESKEIPLFDGVRLVASRNASSAMGGRQRKDLKHSTWFDLLAISLARGLTTHNLQINLAEITERYLNSLEERSTARTERDPVGSARLRRHRYNMIITMMFGVTALGAILVPMGFQMLSIVSGKALLLAKMALLLASINGLKRVANNGVHYGLYQVPNEHYGGYFDRGDLNHPRNVPMPMPVAMSPSLDMGVM